MRTRSVGAALAAVLALAPEAGAGRLDLDLGLAGPDEVRFTGGAAAPAAPPASTGLWTPGDPRDLRGEPRSVQVAAETGQTALGAVGAAQSLRGAGSSKAAKAEGAGFVAVALVSFWRLVKTLWN
jgi:hypothetical protein